MMRSWSVILLQYNIMREKLRMHETSQLKFKNTNAEI